MRACRDLPSPHLPVSSTSREFLKAQLIFAHCQHNPWIILCLHSDYRIWLPSIAISTSETFLCKIDTLNPGSPLRNTHFVWRSQKKKKKAWACDFLFVLATLVLRFNRVPVPWRSRPWQATVRVFQRCHARVRCPPPPLL